MFNWNIKTVDILSSGAGLVVEWDQVADGGRLRSNNWCNHPFRIKILFTINGGGHGYTSRCIKWRNDHI